eukprot:5020665-Prymnesium_polylepis.1
MLGWVRSISASTSESIRPQSSCAGMSWWPVDTVLTARRKPVMRCLASRTVPKPPSPTWPNIW